MQAELVHWRKASRKLLPRVQADSGHRGVTVPSPLTGELMLGLGVCLHWDGSRKVANRPGCVQSRRRAGTETYRRRRRSHLWD